MRAPNVAGLLLWLGLSFAALGAVADELQGGVTSRPAVVAPTVRFLQNVAHDPPRFLRPGIVTPEAFLGSIRTSHALSLDEVERLEKLGVRFRSEGPPRAQSRGPSTIATVPPTDAGKPTAPPAAHIGTVYPAWVPWTALPALACRPEVRQIEPEYPISPLPALDVTRPMTGSPWLGDLAAMTTGKEPGESVLIAAIDMGIDVFHPLLFFPDGGYRMWVDVDGDGTLVPGVDGVDWDGDGQIADGEVLRLLDAGFLSAPVPQGLTGDGVFEPGVDWLYLDVSGNGRRDHGADAGWWDKEPGFGEPMFMLDDVDRDGQTDLSEKLVTLGKTKIVAALAGGTEYTGGIDLSTLPPTKFNTLYLGDNGAMHGTAVAGILLGGTPGLTRYTGMAPNARLLSIDCSLDTSMGYDFGSSFLEKAAWARDKGADILVFEVASWGQTFMDGTSNLETAIDALLAEDNIVTVAPAGNLAGMGVHMHRTLPPGESVVSVDVPGGKYNPNQFESGWFVLSLYWPGEADDLQLALKVPGETQAVVVPLETTVPFYAVPKIKVESHASVSEKGIAWRYLMVWDVEDWQLNSGVWEWTVVNSSGVPLDVHGYLMEGATTWQRTLTFLEGETDESTLCHPATATGAVSVGACAGRDGAVGTLRHFSGRGPRIDGFLGLDLAAPDDPITALSSYQSGGLVVEGGYWGFGGTSGATPHVAGSLALLRQHMPDATGQELFDALLSGAAQEPSMGTLPNNNWGHGKLDVYKAGTGTEAPVDNKAPLATAVLSGRQGLKAFLDASGSTDPEGKPLQFRWDFDYDGKPDGDWSDSPTAEHEYPKPGPVVAKLALRDVHGAQAAALAAFEVLDDQAEPGPDQAEPGPETSQTHRTEGPDETSQSDGFAPNPPSEGSDLSDPSDTSNPAKRSGGCSAGAASPGAGGLALAFLALLCLRQRWRLQ